VSFQFTVLKVLAGHPTGRASLDELRRAVVILMSSGTDWTARTRRMVARVPDLSIFGRSLFLRDSEGWQITRPRARCLACLERQAPMLCDKEEPPLTPCRARTSAAPAAPARLVGGERRGRRRRARMRIRPSRSLNLLRCAPRPSYFWVIQTGERHGDRYCEVV